MFDIYITAKQSQEINEKGQKQVYNSINVYLMRGGELNGWLAW